MEEPDSGTGVKPEVTFQAKEEGLNAASLNKKEVRKKGGGRMKLSKSTPRPVLKGVGRKRFNLSPSPKCNPVPKRASTETEVEDEISMNTHKRNLLEELNMAAVSAGKDERIQQREDTEKSDSLPERKQSSPEPESVTVGEMTHLQEDDKEGQGLQAIVLADSPLGCQFGNNSKEGGKSGEISKSNLDNPQSTPNLPFVPCLDNDLQLDLSASQPLLNHPQRSENWHQLSMPDVGLEQEAQPPQQAAPSAFELEFPALNQGSTRNLREKFERMQQGPNPWQHKPNLQGSHVQKPGQKGGVNGMRPPWVLNGHMGNDRVPLTFKEPERTIPANWKKQDEQPDKSKEPFVLQPEKIAKIGSVGLSEGRPSLYFSCEDTAYLEEKMGYAIVGKFSHSIPSNSQVQNMLNNMEFANQFSWNYINAKHIIIQFEAIEDYAMMLNGPNGAPVWYIDHQPMRVFKWTPSFDSFFETPIAAVWCNIIAVPIHLFEVSALYAIGSLLGNPILLDHATANKTRLSFARICVEIDISKPPTEEIILDIMGKETCLKVKWEKIPPYCRECRHVGHVSKNCRAFGAKNTAASSNNPSSFYPRKHQAKQQPFANRGKELTNLEGRKERQGKEAQGMQQEFREHSMHKGGTAKQGTNGNHTAKPASPTIAEFLNTEGFIKQGRRGKKNNQGASLKGQLSRSSSADRGMMEMDRSSTQEEMQGTSSMTTEHPRYKVPGDREHEGKQVWSLQQYAKPSYFVELEQGAFSEDIREEGVDMEEDPTSREGVEGSKIPPDKISGGKKGSEGSSKQGKDGVSTLRGI